MFGEVPSGDDTSTNFLLRLRCLFPLPSLAPPVASAARIRPTAVSSDVHSDFVPWLLCPVLF